MKLLFFFLFLSTSLISQISKDTLILNMLSEINKVREKPTSIIPDIEKRIESSERILKMLRTGKMSGDSLFFIKNIEAAKELIVELNSMKSLKPLKIDTGINKVARYHCEYLDNCKYLDDLIKSGKSLPLRVFHISYTSEALIKLSYEEWLASRNGETLSDRFKKFNYASENVAGIKKDMKEIIIDLLIDNGIEDRGHRKNLLNPNITHVGIYIGKKYCVQNFVNLKTIFSSSNHSPFLFFPLFKGHS